MLVEGVPLQPEHLIFMNKTAAEGLNQGRKAVRTIGHLGVNVRSGLILAIGSGYGRFAYGLLSSGFSGRYVGMDIIRNRIEWLQEHFTPVQPNYVFIHDDVKNDHYNPKGLKSRSNYREMLNGERPDTVILMSIFTHMYE